MADPAQLAADEARAVEVIRRVVNVDLSLPREVQPSDDLVLDVQLDSMGLLTLVVELENAFQVALREEDAAVVRTVRELAALVVRRKGEAPAAHPGGAASAEGKTP